MIVFVWWVAWPSLAWRKIAALLDTRNKDPNQSVVRLISKYPCCVCYYHWHATTCLFLLCAAWKIEICHMRHIQCTYGWISTTRTARFGANAKLLEFKMKTRSTKLRESGKLKEGKCFGRLMRHWFDRDVTRSSNFSSSHDHQIRSFNLLETPPNVIHE